MGMVRHPRSPGLTEKTEERNQPNCTLDTLLTGAGLALRVSTSCLQRVELPATCDGLGTTGDRASGFSPALGLGRIPQLPFTGCALPSCPTTHPAIRHPERASRMKFERSRCTAKIPSRLCMSLRSSPSSGGMVYGLPDC